MSDDELVCEEDAYQTAYSDPNLGTSDAESRVLPCGATVPPPNSMPCDADYLRIMDSKANKGVDCHVPASRDRGLRRSERRRLGRDDLLYEAVCDQPHSGAADPKYIDLDLSGLTTPACLEQEHPLLRIRGPGHRESEICDSLNIGRIYAPRYETPANGWISEFWDFSDKVKEYRVHLDSCGVRPDGTPNSSLTAKVRAYAKQDLSIRIGLPALGRVQHSRSGSRRSDGQNVSSTSSSRRRGSRERADSSTNTTNLGQAQSETVNTRSLTTSDGRRYNTRTTDSFDAETGESRLVQGSTSERSGTGVRRVDTNNRVTGEDSVAYEVTPGITFTHNGQSINAAEKISQILNYAQTIRQFWNDVQNWMPQVGWRFGMDLVFLEGEISGTWGLRPVRGIQSSRIVAVDKYFEFDVNIKIVKFTVTLSFGVDIGNCIAGATGTIAGSIALELSTRGRMTTNGDRSCTVTPSITVSLTGTLQACVVGECLGVNAVVAITLAGEGTLAVTDDTPLSCNAAIRLRRGDLVITRRVGRRSQGIAGSPIELFGARTIWEGEVL